ncbi:MAG: hypothetical protein KIS92_22150, partial [Planctomycetota bacterium]|nr:hypothetical protein [Planctomycetota bacterium]
AALAPLWSRWGLGFLHGYPFTYPAARTIALRAGEELWGRVGLIAWAGTLTAWLWRRIRRGDPPAAERALNADARTAWWAGLGLFVLLFLCVPLDAGYLIPALPFALLLAASFLERRMFRVLCVLLAAASLLSLGRAGPQAGPLLYDLGLRRFTNARLERALAAAQRLDRPALIVCGVHQPGFIGRLPDAEFARTFDAEAMEAKHPLPFGPARLVYTITRQEAQDARAQGEALYYLADQDAYNYAVTGFDPKEFGAVPLAP